MFWKIYDKLGLDNMLLGMPIATYIPLVLLILGGMGIGHLFHHSILGALIGGGIGLILCVGAVIWLAYLLDN